MRYGIVVPTDGSACATTAVAYATDLANTYGATVHAGVSPTLGPSRARQTESEY